MRPYSEINLAFGIPIALLVTVCASAIAWAASRRAGLRTKLVVRGLILPAFVALNPMSNWVFWEPFNKPQLNAMKAVADREEMEGKSLGEVRQLFGEPSFVWGPNPEGVTTWNYLRPGWYVLGTKFQVHFRNGVVYGWEPFDD